MKVLVPVKRVVDPNVRIRLNTAQTAVDLLNIKMAMNPFDEIALEQAIRLQEANLVTEIIAISIAGDSAQETLRHALALGATQAILVKTDRQLPSLSVATVLAKFVQQEQVQLVLMGKQSIDGDNNQTPQMLAGLLNWSQATFASKLELKDDLLQVTREIDGGLETLELRLPAVVSTDLRLNEPRYTSLSNIMKARQKRLDIVQLDEACLPNTESLQILSLKQPDKSRAAVKLDSVKALVDRLHQEQLL